MFISRLRPLYSFRSIKPAPLTPSSYTHLPKHFCTESKQELKPEDVFGDYASELASQRSQEYPKDDFKESNITIIEAINKIRSLIKSYKFDEANEVLNELKKSKKRPPPHIYKLLFACAARLGKVEEAFKLYNDLKKRGLYADCAMFTSLFYACAKCPRSDIALPIANKLLQHMLEVKKLKPNKTNFNAAMMAYGRHGDISTVMLIIDKLENEGIKLSRRNYNFALESCISQRNNGLRLAVLIWHHMLQKKIVPDSYTFSVLSRCIRDCSLGDSDLCDKFIKSVFENCFVNKFGQGPQEKSHLKGLIVGLKEESQNSYGGDKKGRDGIEINDIVATNAEGKLTETVLNVENKQAEMAESSGSMILDTENEKVQQEPALVKAESSKDCDLAAENKDNIVATNAEGKLTETVLNVENKQAEMVESSGSMILDTENEKVQQEPALVKAESSKDCDLAAENEDESQCVSHSEVAVSEKAVALTAVNTGELFDLSLMTDGSELTETQSGVEFSSKIQAHKFDDSDLPNLLTLKPPGKSIVKFEDFSTPENRLMLFGGFRGFLDTMKNYKANTDIILFSILLECIPSNNEDEEALMAEMKKSRVKIDTAFLNILIRRRLARKEKSSIEDWMDLFKKYRCTPDVVTFGTIARGCLTLESGKKCIDLARSFNIRLNNTVLGCLLVNAGKTGDMVYVSEILKAGKEDATEFDARFVSILKSIVKNEKMRRRKSSC